MKLVWTTDPHLNFPPFSVISNFFTDIKAHGAESLLITGDIAEAHNIVEYLKLINDHVHPMKVYFVLGNHDYYNGNIKDVRSWITKLSKAKSNNLNWMNVSGVISLNKETALIGHDGWADGRNGDWDKSSIMLNDYLMIKELTNDSTRKHIMEQLADEAAEYLEKQCVRALKKHNNIVVLTHFPPFKNACWHMGEISDWEWLPHFSNAVVGPKLTQLMLKHPDKKMTILCGHSHSSGVYKPADNVEVRTGKARYGRPAIEDIIEV